MRLAAMLLICTLVAAPCALGSQPGKGSGKGNRSDRKGSRHGKQRATRGTEFKAVEQTGKDDTRRREKHRRGRATKRDKWQGGVRENQVLKAVDDEWRRGNEYHGRPLRDPREVKDWTGPDRFHGVDHDYSGYPERVQKQLWNEDRKLNHRLQTAEHLRGISARNGNPRLLDTADRMEAKAYSHYEKRMRRILGDQPASDAELSDSELRDNELPGSVVDDGIHQLPDDAAPFDGDDVFEASEYDRAETELQDALDRADRWRELGSRTGDSYWTRRADRLEEEAADRYMSHHSRRGGTQPTYRRQPLGDESRSASPRAVRKSLRSFMNLFD